MKSLEYHDLVLRVGARNGESYPIQLLNSPAGEAEGTFTLNVDAPKWQERLVIVEQARGGAMRGASGATVIVDDLGLRKTEELGQELFESLFSGRIRSCYERSLHQAREERKGLRIRLRIQAPELAALPWEYLIDAERHKLALSRTTPLVRHLEMDRPALRLKLQPPIRILGMIGEHTGLEVAAERKLMEDAIEDVQSRGLITLTWVEGHTWRDLCAGLNTGEYNVFHFIGHGRFDEESGSGKLLLESEGAPGAYELDSAKLGRLLEEHQSLRLAVLNSCLGARGNQGNLYSSTASQLAAHGIPAVVSMQYEISDRAALEFSRWFYDSLAAGMPVEAAVSAARSSIDLALENTVEWGTPVLNMRAGDGLLFEVDVAGAIYKGAPPPPPPVSAPTLAGAPVSGGDVLVKKVKEYWIDGVLSKKLDQMARIDIGFESMASEVSSPVAAFDTPDGTQALDGRVPIDLLNDYGTLLILGEPGCGKTVALLEIARDLLSIAESNELLPIPVVFNLSSWAAKRLTIADWMAEELFAKYEVPRLTGKPWLQGGRLFPLLDGLDEVAASVRAECVVRINEWMGTATTGTVVCCRFKEYRELPEKLGVGGAIRLQPLERDQVLGFLEAAGESLAGLRSLIERDSGLLIDARTPLMLALMARAYRGVAPEALRLETAQGLAARRRMVMGAYVKRELQRAREGGSLV